MDAGGAPRGQVGEGRDWTRRLKLSHAWTSFYPQVTPHSHHGSASSRPQAPPLLDRELEARGQLRGCGGCCRALGPREANSGHKPADVAAAFPRMSPTSPSAPKKHRAVKAQSRVLHVLGADLQSSVQGRYLWLAPSQHQSGSRRPSSASSSRLVAMMCSSCCR